MGVGVGGEDGAGEGGSGCQVGVLKGMGRG